MKSFRSRVMRFVRHWHARVGVMAAIFFLFLALSGLALNHTDALGLVKHEVNNTWLMRWYGFKPAVPTHGYLFEDGYFAASGERWVMNGHVLLDQGLSATRQHLVGAIAWGDMRAISSEDHLFLYLPDGTRVDNLSGAALPNTPIKRLGIIRHRHYAATGAGNRSRPLCHGGWPCLADFESCKNKCYGAPCLGQRTAFT